MESSGIHTITLEWLYWHHTWFHDQKKTAIVNWGGFHRQSGSILDLTHTPLRRWVLCKSVCWRCGLLTSTRGRGFPKLMKLWSGGLCTVPKVRRNILVPPLSLSMFYLLTWLKQFVTWLYMLLTFYVYFARITIPVQIPNGR